MLSQTPTRNDIKISRGVDFVEIGVRDNDTKVEFFIKNHFSVGDVFTTANILKNLDIIPASVRRELNWLKNIGKIKELSSEEHKRDRRGNRKYYLVISEI